MTYWSAEIISNKMMHNSLYRAVCWLRELRFDYFRYIILPVDFFLSIFCIFQNDLEFSSQRVGYELSSAMYLINYCFLIRIFGYWIYIPSRILSFVSLLVTFILRHQKQRSITSIALTQIFCNVAICLMLSLWNFKAEWFGRQLFLYTE